MYASRNDRQETHISSKNNQRLEVKSYSFRPRTIMCYLYHKKKHNHIIKEHLAAPNSNKYKNMHCDSTIMEQIKGSSTNLSCFCVYHCRNLKARQSYTSKIVAFLKKMGKFAEIFTNP